MGKRAKSAICEHDIAGCQCPVHASGLRVVVCPHWRMTRTQMTRILKRAGITVWPKLFQNLRSSRESELMKAHGVEVACEWIGNTPAVAVKHYPQVTDEDIARANGTDAGRQAG
jgi:hypothetical protein